MSDAVNDASADSKSSEEENELSQSTIVIDTGSGLLKAAFSKDEAPQCVFPSLVGRPRHNRITSRHIYIGDHTISKRNMSGADVLSLHFPVEQGVVRAWDDMEDIWSHTFHKELRVEPEEYRVLLTEPPMNPMENREYMTQIMFETFDVEALAVANQALLSLYEAGRTTGVVVESGDGKSHIVPIYEDQVIQHAIKQLTVAGRDITDYLMALLKERFCKDGQFHDWFTVRAGTQMSRELELVRKIKEKLACVAVDHVAQLTQTDTRNYELPDGKTMTIGAERFRCTEPLFDPSLLNNIGAGMDQLTYDSIMSCGADIRNELLQNVVLSGGTTMLGGIQERLTKELRRLAPLSVIVRPRVIAEKKRKYGACVGGCIISSISTFEDKCIWRDEYDETGPSIVHRKCF